MQTDSTTKRPGIKNAQGDIQIPKVLLLTLFVIAAAAFIPTTVFGSEALTSSYPFALISVALPILGIVLCAMITASVRPIIPFCIITAMVMFMGMSLSTSATIPVFFAAVAIAAFLISELPFSLSCIFTAFSAVAAFACAYLLTDSFYFAAFSLLFLPVAMALSRAFKKGKMRVEAVCSISAALGVCAIALLLAWVYINDKSISPDTLKSFFVTLKEGLIGKISEAMYLVYSQIEEMVITQADALELTTLVITALFNFLPAIFVVILFLISYLTHSLFVSLEAPVTDDQEKIKNAVTFKMSVISAIIFFVAFIATLVLSFDGHQLYATAAQNICVMLYPGLTLITFAFINSFTKGRNASCLGYILYMIFIALFFNFPAEMLSISSFAGAVLVIISTVQEKRKNKKDN